MHLVSFEDDNEDRISFKIYQKKFMKDIMKKSQIDTKLYINKIFIFSNKYYDNVVRNIDEIKKIDIAKGISKLMGYYNKNNYFEYMPIHNRSAIDQHLREELKDQNKLNTYEMEFVEYCNHNFLEQKHQINEEGDILLFKLKPVESSYQLILKQGLIEYKDIIWWRWSALKIEYKNKRKPSINHSFYSYIESNFFDWYESLKLKFLPQKMEQNRLNRTLKFLNKTNFELVIKNMKSMPFWDLFQETRHSIEHIIFDEPETLGSIGFYNFYQDKEAFYNKIHQIILDNNIFKETLQE